MPHDGTMRRWLATGAGVLCELPFFVADQAYMTIDELRRLAFALKRQAGLDVLILDALRERPHPTHLSLGESLEIIAELQPRRAYLTHICHDIDHATVSKRLPRNVALAYDGLRIQCG